MHTVPWYSVEVLFQRSTFLLFLPSLLQSPLSSSPLSIGGPPPGVTDRRDLSTHFPVRCFLWTTIGTLSPASLTSYILPPISSLPSTLHSSGQHKHTSTLASLSTGSVVRRPSTSRIGHWPPVIEIDRLALALPPIRPPSPSRVLVSSQQNVRV